MAKKANREKRPHLERENRIEEIDYDKLADAIVRAHYIIESKRKEHIEEEIYHWRQIFGIKDYPHRPIRQFFNTVVSLMRMAIIKKEKVTTAKTTYNLIRLAAEGSFALIKILLYFAAFGFFIKSFQCGSNHEWGEMVLRLLTASTITLLAIFFRVASFEVSNMRDRVEVLSISSTIAAFAALMVSLVALVVEVFIK